MKHYSLKFILHLFILLVYNQLYAQWQHANGPYGGYIKSLFVDQNTGLMYAGTDGGGIFRTANDGADWVPINNGLKNLRVFSIIVNGSNLFAGTYGDGVFRSNDNGGTWIQDLAGSPSSYIKSLIVYKNNIFAGTQNGVFRSADNGKNWIQLINGLTNKDICALTANENYLFAGSGNGVFRTADSGNNWTLISGGSLNTNLSSLIFANGILFAGCWGNGIFYSKDNGTTWTNVTKDGLGIVKCLAASNNYIFASGLNAGIFRSEDNGITWSVISNGLINNNKNIQSIAFNSNYIFAGGENGVYLSSDNGNNWRQVNNGMTALDIHSIALNNSDIFAGNWYNGIFRTSTKSLTWVAQNIDNVVWDINCLATNENNIFVGTHGVGVFRSTDNGLTWKRIEYSIINSTIRSILIHDSSVYVGTYNNVCKSIDNGGNWVSFNNGLPGKEINALAIINDYIFAATYEGGIYRSNKDEANWTLKNNGITNNTIWSLAVKGTYIFAGTWDGLFLSIDYGITWLPVNNGLTNRGIFSIVVNGNNLFAGTQGGGIFTSNDDGTTWRPVNEGITNLNIKTLAVNNQNLYAGTVGNSVFVASICSLTTPDSVGIITGSSSACKNQINVGYSVPKISESTYYLWTFPSGVTGSSNSNTISLNFGPDAVSGLIKVKGHNQCGDIPQSSIAISVNTFPDKAKAISGKSGVCKNQSNEAYSTSTIPGATSYEWTLPSGSSGTSNKPIIIIDFGLDAVSGYIKVKGHNDCGDGIESGLAITLNTVPGKAGIIAGDSIVCKNQGNVIYSVPAISGATYYEWTLPAGATGSSTTNKMTVNFGADAISGDIKVKGGNECGKGIESKLSIKVNTYPGNADIITGQTNVCKNQNYLTYSVPAISGAIFYDWSLPSGVTGISSTNIIKLNFGESSIAGQIKVKGGNNCGKGAESSLLIKVDSIPNKAGIISGNAIVCIGQEKVTYTVPNISGATTYNWTLPAGTTGLSTTNNIDVQFGPSAISGEIYVNGHNDCSDGTKSSLTITVNTKPDTASGITGITTVCKNNNNIIYTVPTIKGAISYIWTLPEDARGSSTTNSINLNFDQNAVSGNIKVKGINDCGEGPESSLPITIITIPEKAGIITGDSIVCKNQNNIIYSLPAISDAISYEWTLPPGASGSSTANSITVNFGEDAISGKIKVKGRNDCGDGTESELSVTVNSKPADAGVITGISNICNGQGNLDYSVPTVSGADSYIWTLPDGANGTSKNNKISVNFGVSTVSGNITVKGQNNCGEGIESKLEITVNPLPGAAGDITGNTKVLNEQKDVIYSVLPIENATSYIWTLPQGAIGNSEDASIKINFNGNAVSGHIKVKGHNDCGDGPESSLAILVNGLPVAAGEISGKNVLCKGQTNISYAISPIEGATSYIWTLPTGITGNSKTNNISVSVGEKAVSGIISVKGLNEFGEGKESTLPVEIKSTPSGISEIMGKSNVCVDQKNVVYTVLAIPDATSYIWELPYGAEGISSANNISVSFGENAITGNIVVSGQNECGEGQESRPFQVNVNSGLVVANAEILSKFDKVLVFKDPSHQFTSFQWYNQDGQIEDETAQFYKPPLTRDGEYYAVATDKSGCTRESNHLKFPPKKSTTFNVYPNPASVNLILTVNSIYESNIDIRIYNSFGMKVKQSEGIKDSEIFRKELLVRDLVQGLYVIEILTGDERKFEKLMINY